MKSGVVVIGRNEGRHLNQCLESIIKETNCIVYVDSGSTDNSLDIAYALKVPVVELDPKVPFTAARAHNAGLAFLLETYPQLEFVQFIDGDCEIVPGWLALAQQELKNQPHLAVVCGRLSERFPQATA
ncbi:glycosyltransferase [Gloeothece verrucosa]|uniref:glycosyltransferase n=1 Tax=Gloeothece verrucosa TaxID=2546359 RepID=UPI00031E1FD6